MSKRLDGLDQYPDFGPPDIMPWDQAPPSEAAGVWIDGTPLTSFSSQTLLAHRRLLVRKNGRGTYFSGLIGQIDAVLGSRMGE